MSSVWLGFDTESDVTQWSYQPGLPISAAVLAEALAAAERVVAILARHRARATFFLVGRLLEVAGSEYRDLLAGHDVQCHTYAHHLIHQGHPLSDSPEEVEEGLRRGLDLIEEWFGYRPVGLCAPGGSRTGLRGQPEILRIVWDNGIRFVKADNLGSPETPMLPSRIHPYTYAEDGYPDLWELPGIGWHCTLTLPRGPVGDWPPRAVVPGGPRVGHPPLTPQDHLAWVRQELDYVRAQGYQFSPSWHPWSLYRFDPQMHVVDFLLDYAAEKGMAVRTYREVWEGLTGGTDPATV
jgi:peptidoglycan/xylan/chitin deacetylase (PgdA/CDA1 family)